MSDSVLATPQQLLSPIPTPPKPSYISGEGLLPVGDIPGTRRAIYDRVLSAASNIAPFNNGRREMRIVDVHYRPGDPEDYTPAEHKRAILENRTLGRRLRGTVVLRDIPTGKELDRKTLTLATVPWLSGDGAFVSNGVDTSVSHQMRLRPGSYTRVKQTGEIENHVNVLPGKGPSHRYRLDPETGKFVVEIHQAQLPLMPLLRAAGLTDQELEAAWGAHGKELVALQRESDTPHNLARVYKAVAGRKADANFAQMTRPEQLQALASLLPSWEIDSDISQKTLGGAYSTIDKDALKAITSKLIRVAAGEDEVDDRDQLAYQKVLGPDDLFAERIARDYGRTQRGLFNEAARRGNLQHLSPGMLQKQLQSVFTKSGLANSLEEANPSEILDRVYRVSRMGEGGLPSTDSIPQESRMVSPSHYGFIDPARTVESLRVGVDLYLAGKLRRDADGNIYAPIRNTETGQTEWRTPREISELPLGFNERSDNLNVPAIVNGKLQYADRNLVKHRPEHFEDAFSPLAQLIPMKSGTPAQRVAMGSRMITQAVALTNPEAPLVRGAVDGDPSRSYEEQYGSVVGALRADRGGEVLLVSPDSIRVRYDDGEIKDIGLDNNRPMNRKSFRHQTPMVEMNQRFAPGDLLAKSNYTDDKGAMALGANFRTAYMPFRGLNHEDAIVISRSAAKRLQSEHAYQHTMERSDDTKFGREAFRSVFPGKFSQEVMARLDEDGVIKPGQTVNYGDPLVTAMSQSDDNPGRLLRGKRPISRDVSLLWEHHAPGVVTDAVKTKDGVNVVVKSLNEMQTGDKLSGRVGDKGVVHIVPDEHMPQDKDGNPIEVIVSDLGVLSRGNASQVAEALLGKVARKTGQHINVPDFKDIDDLTDWARQVAAQHGISDQEDLYDPVENRKIPGVLTGERFFMKLHHLSESKGQGRGIGGYTQDERPAKSGETGCFVATQRVVTSRGWMPIGRICEKRRGEQVLTYSERLQEWVFRPITNWFVYDAPAEDVLSIECFGPCENDKGSDVKKYTARHHVNATKNHKMKLFDGSYKLAGELQVGDELVTWGVEPTQHQHEILVGMLMGDGSVDKNAIMCTHSGKQSPYFDWKLRMLASLSPTWCEGFNKPRVTRKGYINHGGRYRVMSLCNRLIAEPYARLCLRNGQRTVTTKWLAQMTGLSVAVLFLDDGTATYKGMTAKSRYPAGSLERAKFTGAICTQGFTRKGVQRLRRWLMTRYDIKCSIGEDNRINLSARACRALIREVARWIPWQVIPRSKRGIRRVVRRLQEVTPPQELKVTSKLTKRPMPVRSISPYRHRKGRKTLKVYDIEVAGTHTYCAGPSLVSNSKTIGLLQSNAIMSHGATGLLRDVAEVRGQSNPEYWMAVRQGIAPPAPRVPYTYQKFVNELQAGGIHVASDGTQINVMALTDKDIDRMAGTREITRNDLVRLDDELSPVRGGLFDPTLTGGHGGKHWSRIRLPEPMPSPVMEEPIRRLLGLTTAKFRDVLAGKDSIDSGSGPQAIYKALDAIDIPKELDRVRKALKHGRKSDRDLAERQLGYLKGAQKTGQHPREWMVNSIPVLPPQFRPITLMQHNDQPQVADINYLYREAIDARDNLRDMKQQVDDVSDERLGLYDAFGAITGLVDPQHPKLVEKQVGGVLQRVFGKGSAKYGTVQRKLLSRQVDLVGRAVVVPNPDLDIDSVGLPENRAWPLYNEFVVGRLRRRGFPVARAMAEVQNRTPLAREELLREMEKRPVYVDRAPVLHRFGTLAFYPRLVAGDSMHVSPAVLTGFAMDFDGDTAQYHVPANDEAIPEILERMLPSRNLLSPADFKTPMPVAGKEFIGGLFTATKPAREGARVVRFLNRKAAIEAARRGELPLDTPVEVDD